MLTVANLTAGYGRARVISEMALTVETGSVVALMGRNGAGKSTTLKAIIGLVDGAGRIDFGGQPILGLSPHAICRRGIAYVPEDRRVFADLTVAENLEVGHQPPRADAPAWSADAVFDLFPQLAPLRGRLAGRLSGGEQQMLTIARGLMGNPRLLLLDEPSEGLAPRVVSLLASAVRRLKDAGVGVLVAEQNRRFASAVADAAVVLENGRVAWRGAVADVSGAAGSNPSIKEPSES